VSMTDHSSKIEVITSVQRRRRWSGSEKMRMVEETYEPGATVSLVARRHGVAPNQLFTWRRLAAEGALTATTAGEEVVPASEHRALQQQVRELHRLLGKKTLDVEILKEVLDQAEPKKRLLLRSSSVTDASKPRSFRIAFWRQVPAAASSSRGSLE
jgi:transposase